ncbi:MAG: 50S ribosomal protein L4 [Chloroflexi bacterium RBG_13_54_9]|nr:MAG: 50S ribosomal protein L4 [Chloroflexi bacterium RBG_13_54_9]
MRVSVHNHSGEIVNEIELSESVFGVSPNEAVVHQALVRQLANARQGNASTKTRGEVSGSTAKLFRQKGTGRARQGSIRSPLHRGGGIVFGPRPRSYRQAMPKKMRRLALKSVLSAKAAEGNLVVVDEFGLETPKTKDMVRILEALGVESSALIVTPEKDENVVRSAGNIAGVKTLPAHVLNVADLLSHKDLIMTVEAVREVERIWAQERTRGG